MPSQALQRVDRAACHGVMLPECYNVMLSGRSCRSAYKLLKPASCRQQRTPDALDACCDRAGALATPFCTLFSELNFQMRSRPAMLWMAPMSFCRASGWAEFARYAACAQGTPSLELLQPTHDQESAPSATAGLSIPGVIWCTVLRALHENCSNAATSNRAGLLRKQQPHPCHTYCREGGCW